MKPFIIVCGVPHSFTSMVSKFLIDNGAVAKETWDNPRYNELLGYSRFEDKEIQIFVNRHKDFKKYDLTHYFASFPADKVCMAKHPRLAFYLNELAEFTDRPIKVVYVQRNPEQIILSSMEKSKKSFIYYYERIIWMYRFMVDCQFPVFPLISERIEKDAEQLLSFCELPVSQIDYHSIRPISYRKPTFFKYRFANFIWKRLSKLFLQI